MALGGKTEVPSPPTKLKKVAEEVAMNVFGMFVVFSLAVMGLTMVGAKYFHFSRENWMFLAGAMGVALAWLAGFDMWTLFHVHVRADWVGTTLTGVALGGGALFCHSFTSFFAGLHRKLDDQAEVLELRDLRKVA